MNRNRSSQFTKANGKNLDQQQRKENYRNKVKLFMDMIEPNINTFQTQQLWGQLRKSVDVAFEELT